MYITLELLGRFASNFECGTRLNNGNVFIIYFYHRFINSKITGLKQKFRFQAKLGFQAMDINMYMIRYIFSLIIDI